MHTQAALQNLYTLTILIRLSLWRCKTFFEQLIYVPGITFKILSESSTHLFCLFEYPSRVPGLNLTKRAQLPHAVRDLLALTSFVLHFLTSKWGDHPQHNNQGYEELVQTWSFASTCCTFGQTAYQGLPSLQSHPLWVQICKDRIITTTLIYHLKPKCRTVLNQTSDLASRKSVRVSKAGVWTIISMAIFNM